MKMSKQNLMQVYHTEIGRVRSCSFLHVQMWERHFKNQFEAQKCAEINKFVYLRRPKKKECSR